MDFSKDEDKEDNYIACFSSFVPLAWIRKEMQLMKSSFSDLASRVQDIEHQESETSKNRTNQITSVLTRIEDTVNKRMDAFEDEMAAKSRSIDSKVRYKPVALRSLTCL